MQKILMVKNGELEEINNLLEEGWNVKIIKMCSESVSVGGQSSSEMYGDIYAYIVLEK